MSFETIEEYTIPKYKMILRKQVEGEKYQLLKRFNKVKTWDCEAYGTKEECEERANVILTQVKEEKERWEREFAERKVARTKLFKELELGTIVSENCGYSAHFVHFYEVVGKRGTTILELRELNQSLNAKDCMVGYASPVKGEYRSEEVITVRFGKYDGETFGIKDNYGSRCKVWDGEAKHYDHAD